MREVKGAITASFIGAGVNPVDQTFGNTGDQLVGGTASSIGSIKAKSAFAVPNYLRYGIRARRSDGQNLLLRVATAQERFYSILPFLAQHGMDLVDRLYKIVQTDCPDHRVVTI